MEPQPQLQPVAPRPQLDYAEPTGRSLELKPGPRPLDLRPRPTGRPQLDIKYGPASPAESALQRANPLGNPLNVAQPVVNNPLGYAPGKGLAGAAAVLAARATDPATFGVPAEELFPSSIPLLAMPNAFPIDAIDTGPETAPGTAPINWPANAAFGVHINQTPRRICGQMVEPYIFINSSTAGSTGSGTVAYKTSPDGPTLTVSNVRINDFFWGHNPLISGTGTGASGYTGTACSSPSYSQPAGEPQRAPNQARRLPAPVSLPAPREQTGLQPTPTPSPAPAIAPAPSFFIPYRPPAIDPGPEIRPVRPGRPEEPRKLPPVPTIPRLPGGDTDAPNAPTKRPPPVEFPPVAPGTTGRELDPPRLPPLIPIFIPPLRRDDCATGADLAREAGRIRDLIEEILERLLDDCKDLCGEAQLTRAFCEEINGELIPRQEFQTYNTLAPALGFLSREIAAIKAIADPCGVEGAESVPPMVLGGGSMIEGNTVAYVDISPEVRQVELIITGQIPNSLRLYDSTLSGEQQGKFGAITLAYPGVTGGNAPDAFHQWAWTRRTSFYVGPPIRNDRRIRINLKPLLTWVLYDTGLRS